MSAQGQRDRDAQGETASKQVVGRGGLFEAWPGNTSVPGTLLSPWIPPDAEGLLTIALGFCEVSTPPSVIWQSLKNAITDSELRLVVADLVVRVAQELRTDGPYGDAWMELARMGFLPAPPSFVKMKVVQIRYFHYRSDYHAIFYHLNGLSMIDMVDVLRRVMALLDSMSQHVGNEGRPFDVGRLRAAIDTVRTGAMQPAPATLPQDQQEILRAYATLGSWPHDPQVGGLRRARRHGTAPQVGPSTHLRVDPNKAINAPGGRLIVPDTGERLDDLSDYERAVVELIARVREDLPTRADLKVHASKKGYVYNGKKHTPTAIKDTTPPTGRNGIPADRQRQIDIAVYNELCQEGGSSAIMAYDDGAKLGLGHGFILTVLLRVMKLFLASDPAAAKLLKDVGIYCNEKTWHFVNTTTGRVEEGDDAVQFIRFNAPILSLLMNLFEDSLPGETGTNHGQLFVDAQWQTIVSRGFAGDVPAWAATLSDDLIRFIAHCVHYGAPPWSAYRGKGLEECVRIRATNAPVHSQPHPSGGRVVSGEGAVAILTFAKSRGKGIAMSVTQPVTELPTTPDHSGQIFFDLGSSARYIGSETRYRVLPASPGPAPVHPFEPVGR